jgi:hypothetical protein
MKCIRLENYPRVFEKVAKLPDVQSDLTQYLRPGGKSVYMIVGLAIWTDPVFTENRSAGSKFDVGEQIPIATIGAAAGLGVPLPTDVGDPKIGHSSKSTSENKLDGKLPGSYIFAFEYKAVRRKAYSVMKDFTPKLEDCGPRGKGDRVFGGEGKAESDRARSEDLGTLIVDDGEVVWTDTVSSMQLEEVDVGGISFAVSGTKES